MSLSRTFKPYQLGFGKAMKCSCICVGFTLLLLNSRVVKECPNYFCCCDKTRWPRQLTEEKVYLTYGSRGIRVRDDSRRQAAGAAHLQLQTGSRECRLKWPKSLRSQNYPQWHTSSSKFTTKPPQTGPPTEDRMSRCPRQLGKFRIHTPQCGYQVS